MTADLSAAVDAAYRGWRSAQRGAPVPDAEFVATFSRIEAEWMTAAVAAAALLIEAQVRAQVAQEIEENLAERPARGRDFDDGYQFASEVAARIARGVS